MKVKRNEDNILFDEKVPINYSPEDFYSELSLVQNKLHCRKSLSYIEKDLINQLKKDNNNFINSFQEIKKFRRYYTCQIIYDFVSRDNSTNNKIKDWAKPFTIDKECKKRSSLELDNLQDFNVLDVLPDILKKSNYILINEILSYSVVPGIFSYFLSDKDNYFYINEFDSFIQKLKKKKIIDIRSDDKYNYETIKVYLKSAFIMPQFINFLRKVTMPIFSPYVRNEKIFSESDLEIINSEVANRIDLYRSLCPNVIIKILIILMEKEGEEEKREEEKREEEKREGKKKEEKMMIRNNQDDLSLCHAVLKDCLFNPLQKDPVRYMCSDVSFYEIKREKLQEDRIYRNFFKILFGNRENLLTFIDNFANSLTQKYENITYNENSLRLKYYYFYPFDIKLMKFDQTTDFNIICSSFLNFAESRHFTLCFHDNLFKFSNDANSKQKEKPSNSRRIDTGSLRYKIIQILERSPRLKYIKEVPKDHLLDIIDEYMINKNDPLLVGPDYDLFKQIETIWTSKDGTKNFPTKKEDLANYFDPILEEQKINDDDIEKITLLLKEKGEFQLKKRLSVKALRHMDYFMNIMTIKRLYKVTYNSSFYKNYFPRSACLVKDPKENLWANLEIILKEFDKFDKEILNGELNLQSFRDFNTLLSGFFLGCNLKYNNYILLKPELKRVDLYLHKLIDDKKDDVIDKFVDLYLRKLTDAKKDDAIYKLVDLAQKLYKNTFGSSPAYFTEDIIKLRAAFDANVDPHKKLFMIETVIIHAIRKIKNQFFVLSQDKNKEFNYKVFFMDLLIAYANPNNLFSNIVFMMEYQVKLKYSNSIGKYFARFLELFKSEVNRKNYTIDPAHFTSPASKAIKKILIVKESEVKLSTLLSRIIPAPIDWNPIDKGEDVSFPVSKKKIVVANCLFSVSKEDKDIVLNNFDALILFFDLNVGFLGQKKPKKLDMIIQKIQECKKTDITKIAICNTGGSTKKFDISEFNIFDNIFEFSKDKLNVRKK